MRKEWINTNIFEISFKPTPLMTEFMGDVLQRSLEHGGVKTEACRHIRECLAAVFRFLGRAHGKTRQDHNLISLKLEFNQTSEAVITIRQDTSAKHLAELGEGKVVQLPGESWRVKPGGAFKLHHHRESGASCFSITGVIEGEPADLTAG